MSENNSKNQKTNKTKFIGVRLDPDWQEAFVLICYVYNLRPSDVARAAVMFMTCEKPTTEREKYAICILKNLARLYTY